MKLNKKEINYFDKFVEMSYAFEKAAFQLEDLLNNFNNVEEKANLIHDTEHECDNILHCIRHELNISFITPIDREDIILLSNKLDTVTDNIEDVANLFDMFSVAKIYPEALTMCKLIVQGCSELVLIVKEFKTFRNQKSAKKLIEMVVHLNQIEEEADRLYRSIIKQLFTSNLPDIEVVKWKDIYYTMEEVIDSCESVANLIEGLVIKNS